MKQLKLEVGKTYRSREGEEVKIVSKNDRISYPYKGSNGGLYTERGSRWRYLGTEDPEDLIEEVPETSHTFAIVPEALTARYHFQIPEGTKGINVSKEGNRIVVEMVPEKAPKPGDVMVNDWGSVYIFKSIADYGNHNYYARVEKNGRLSFEWIGAPGRPATPEEAQPLWGALKKAGKIWNPETMQVEETEIERIREWVEKHLEDGRYDHEWLAQVISRYLKHKEGGK